MRNLLDIQNDINVKENSINVLTEIIEQVKIGINSFEYECSESEFDEYLDEEGEQHTSVGSFYPSDILKSCDPISYHCAKSDYEANYDLDDCEEYTNMQNELENLESELDDLENDLEELQNEYKDFFIGDNDEI